MTFPPLKIEAVVAAAKKALDEREAEASEAVTDLAAAKADLERIGAKLDGIKTPDDGIFWGYFSRLTSYNSAFQEKVIAESALCDVQRLAYDCQGRLYDAQRTYALAQRLDAAFYEADRCDDRMAISWDRYCELLLIEAELTDLYRNEVIERTLSVRKWEEVKDLYRQQGLETVGYDESGAYTPNTR